MKWEEFFKPTKKKVIYAIIIQLILSFIPIVPFYCIYKCVGCQGIEYHMALMIWGFCENIISTYLVIFGELIISYSIACWFFTVYKKK
jgi:hypothetical protein